MTAVLQNLRQLEAARRRGELSLSEYAARRADMMDAVEDADLDADDAPNLPTGRSTPPGTWAMVAVLIAGCVVLTALGTWATGDLSLALTVSVTLLAALTVTAFQTLGD